MDLYGILICTAMFLCSVDGINTLRYAHMWFKMKLAR